MRYPKTYQSVKDMPPIMRIVVECLTADQFRRGSHWDTERIALKINTTVATVQAHISRAMRATGTTSRRELAEWARKGRGLEIHDKVKIPHIVVRQLGAWDTVVEKRAKVPISEVFNALTVAHPLELVTFVSRWRESPEGRRKLQEAREALAEKENLPAPINPDPPPPRGPRSLAERRAAKLDRYRIKVGLKPLGEQAAPPAAPAPPPPAVAAPPAPRDPNKPRTMIPYRLGEGVVQHEYRMLALYGPLPDIPGERWAQYSRRCRDNHVPWVKPDTWPDCASDPVPVPNPSVALYAVALDEYAD